MQKLFILFMCLLFQVKYLEGFIVEVIAMTQKFLCSLWDSAAHVLAMKITDLLPVQKEAKNLFQNFYQNSGGHGL